MFQETKLKNILKNFFILVKNDYILMLLNQNIFEFFFCGNFCTKTLHFESDVKLNVVAAK